MISISKLTRDANYGNVVIHELSSSDLSTRTARVSRTATLDGGVYINHSGVTDGDRTLRIEARITKEQDTILQNIYRTQTFVLIAVSDGIYSGAIDTLKTNNGSLKMTILVKQKEY